ncbi:potassium:proton antiporter [Alteromonas gracilis]|uniref:potassium:proton antiporter n=1 Tax=Alteromonas gracilis TaxID=1479524 RepID=UPI002FDFE975
MLILHNAHMHNSVHHRATGFSITELLVACALSGLLISIVASYAAQSHVALSSLQHATSLKEDMRALKSTISQHLGRAGFIEEANILSPFIALSSGHAPASNVALSERSTEPSNSCITFSYDKNKDGAISQSQGEVFGYRLNNKAIEYRVNGNTCEQGGWFDLTDPETLSVTQFSANRIHQSSWGSAYEIKISLQSIIDTEVQSHESFIVEVPNDG